MKNIELLDYFAAHAPEVPEWFEGDLPKEPEFPNPIKSRLSTGQLNFYNRYYNDEDEGVSAWCGMSESPMAESIQPIIDAWQADLKEYQRKRDDFYKLPLKMMRLCQWRFEFALGMLNQRNSIIRKSTIK